MNIVHEIQKWNEEERKYNHSTHSRTDSCSSLSINPEERTCPKFDEKSMATFDLGDLTRQGFTVLDNCAEEHIQ